MQTKIH